jgi:hypothetical protein
VRHIMGTCKRAVPPVSMCWEPERSSSTAGRSIAWSATCPLPAPHSRCGVPGAYPNISPWHSVPTGSGYPATSSGAKKSGWAWRLTGSAELHVAVHRREVKAIPGDNKPLCHNGLTTLGLRFLLRKVAGLIDAEQVAAARVTLGHPRGRACAPPSRTSRKSAGAACAPPRSGPRHARGGRD